MCGRGLFVLYDGIESDLLWGMGLDGVVGVCLCSIGSVRDVLWLL